ncbi:MAG: radical SAM/SPASM domain-containing protein [Syntrophomonas sp.]
MYFNSIKKLLEANKYMSSKELVVNLLRKLQGKQFIPYSPQVLHVELNNTCNLNCKMCPRDHLNRKPQNMSFDLYTKIINEAASLNIPKIRLFLFGEPLLYPNLIEAIKCAKDKGIMHVDFNTNANLLKKEIAHKIACSGLDEIIFSVDGFSRQTYEKIRKKGDYDKCINNILYFLDFLNNEKIVMKTSIQTINFDEIIPEIEKYKLFWGNKVDNVYVTYLNPMQGLVKEINYAGYKRIVCNEAFSKMVILSNGKVTTCCDDFNGDLNLGDTNVNTIEEIWNSPKYSKLRKDFNQLNYSDYSICNNCFLSYKIN